MKSPGIAAFPAQFFHCCSVAETVIDRFCPVSFQNIGQILCEQIAKIDIAFVIQSAGDYSSVAENTYLITKAVAEDPVTLIRRGKIRPIEFVTGLQIDPLSDPDPAAFLRPLSGKIAAEGTRDGVVQFVQSALIPQTVGDQKFTFCGFAEFEAIPKILLKIHRRIIGFESMKGYVDLMQVRTCQQHFLLLAQQGAVGGEDHSEAKLAGNTQILR